MNREPQMPTRGTSTHLNATFENLDKHSDKIKLQQKNNHCSSDSFPNTLRPIKHLTWLFWLFNICNLLPNKYCRAGFNFKIIWSHLKITYPGLEITILKIPLYYRVPTVRETNKWRKKQEVSREREKHMSDFSSESHEAQLGCSHYSKHLHKRMENTAISLTERDIMEWVNWSFFSP